MKGLVLIGVTAAICVPGAISKADNSLHERYALPDPISTNSEVGLAIVRFVPLPIIKNRDGSETTDVHREPDGAWLARFEVLSWLHQPPQCEVARGPVLKIYDWDDGYLDVKHSKSLDWPGSVRLMEVFEHGGRLFAGRIWEIEHTNVDAVIRREKAGIKAVGLVRLESEAPRRADAYMKLCNAADEPSLCLVLEAGNSLSRESPEIDVDKVSDGLLSMMRSPKASSLVLRAAQITFDSCNRGSGEEHAKREAKAVDFLLESIHFAVEAPIVDEDRFEFATTALTWNALQPKRWQIASAPRQTQLRLDLNTWLHKSKLEGVASKTNASALLASLGSDKAGERESDR